MSETIATCIYLHLHRARALEAIRRRRGGHRRGRGGRDAPASAYGPRRPIAGEGRMVLQPGRDRPCALVPPYPASAVRGDARGAGSGPGATCKTATAAAAGGVRSGAGALALGRAAA